MGLLAVGGVTTVGLGMLVAIFLARQIEEQLAILTAGAAALGRGETPSGGPVQIREFQMVGDALIEAGARLRQRDAERDEFESRQRLLLVELDHRVRNTLASVQAIARLSLPRAPATDAYLARLRALATAHIALAQAQWKGASLRRLVHDTVAAHGSDAERISIKGPDITLNAKASQSLALALHELTTNAAKYGALSLAGGKLDIGWRIVPGDRRYLELEWNEHGGPRIEAPARLGFGSRLLEQIISYELSGSSDAQFKPEGLSYTVRFALAQLEVSESKIESAVPVPSTLRPMSDVMQRILLVEDSALVAAELGDLLASSNRQVIGPARTVEVALALVAKEPLDAAVLDVDINGVAVFPVAKALRARAIPFVFLTGYGDTYAWPSVFSGVPRVSKPVKHEDLFTALANASQDRQTTSEDIDANSS